MFKTKILSAFILAAAAPFVWAGACSAPAASLNQTAQAQKPAVDEVSIKESVGFSAELKEAVTNFESRYPKTQVSAFSLTPFKGLFEAVVGKEIVYFDKSARFVFSGRLLDMDQGKDLTEARLKDLRRVVFKDLPLEKAVKTVYGTGQKKVVVFTDVDCPFSRRLAQTLPKLKDTTVYTFLFPLESIHPEARGKSEAIWCASNPQAQMDAALNGEAVKAGVANNPLCKPPVNDVIALAKKLGVAGTPTLINAAGDRISGALPLEKLEAFIEEGNKNVLSGNQHHES